MPTARIGDCDIHYETFGSGHPLLLVPGLGGVGSYWKPQIDSFADKFKVVIHDHRGTGQSSKSQIRYSLEQMTADVLGLMDELEIESAHILGHSTGGAVGQILASDHPERVDRVIMYATWTKADAFFKRCFEIRRELLVRSGTQAYSRATPVFLYPSWWIRDNEQLLDSGDSIYGQDMVPEIVESRIQALLDFDWTTRLSSIRAPVLVLGVKNDHLTPAYFSEELAALIPNAQLVILADGGHVASQILPDEFNKVVLSFLENRDGQSNPELPSFT